MLTDTPLGNGIQKEVAIHFLPLASNIERMTPLLAAAALVITTSPNFQNLLDQQRIEQDVPGVSAVIAHGNRVLFAGGSGVADLDTARAMTADTPVYAGSIAKVFTAVLTLRLVEEERLSLDASVPGIATSTNNNSPPILVSHLLTHASGLEREGNFGYWFSGRFPQAEELNAYLADTSLRTAPGTKLRYSNVAYAALGQEIERQSGASYADILRSKVLKPLGMTSSGATGPTDNIAVGYSPSGRLIPSAERPFAGVGRKVGDRHVREYHDAAAMSPAFGVYSSARDLGRLAQFLVGSDNPELLSVGMRERMRTRQPSGWGLGLKIGTLDGRAVARHEGWFAAHRSHLLLDIEDGITVVVMTNSDAAAPAEIAEVLYRALLQAGEPRQRPSPSIGQSVRPPP